MKRTWVAFCAVSCICATGLAQVITQQPANQVAAPGGSVTFSVAVSGGGPFRYQWQFDGTNLRNNNIITTIAGSDLICFSGDGGPATNAAISLPLDVAVDGAGNVYLSDSDNNVVRNIDGGVALNCSSPPGSTNVLLASTSLCLQASWQVLSTNIAASDGTWQYTDTTTAGLSARFYRFLTR